MGFLPGFPTIIFTIIRASYWTICFPIFKKQKQAKIVKGEAETINSDVTEGETQREISDIEEEYIPETLPIIISVNQKYKEHLEDNRFLSRMKKIFLFDTDIDPRYCCQLLTDYS